jgi:hypothetical protein
LAADDLIKDWFTKYEFRLVAMTIMHDAAKDTYLKLGSTGTRMDTT